jgi:hypothetical protein
MSALDLDPNYALPLLRALVRYFSAYPPLVQAPQQLELPLPKAAHKPLRNRKATPPAAVRRHSYMPCDLERRLPVQPSP